MTTVNKPPTKVARTCDFPSRCVCQWAAPQERLPDLVGMADYGPVTTQFEECFGPDSLHDHQSLLPAESAHVTDYHYADAPSYAMVHVRPNRIEADLHLGLGKRRWKTVTLTPPVQPA